MVDNDKIEQVVNSLTLIDSKINQFPFGLTDEEMEAIFLDPKVQSLLGQGDVSLVH